MTETASIPNLAVERKSSGILLATLSGNWRGQRELPGLEVIRQALGEGPPVKSLEFDTAELVGWDSRFVAMINFLIGLILAFVGAIQLQRFGASIYVADLVGIATVREMGCVMTGIILCGRTGAAFAAQLGTMKLNEEISALQTFGISPIEFLVLPRMVALILMMPFPCLFADLIIIAGGFFVSVSMLDVAPGVYLTRTIQAIQLKSFLLGIGKGCFFG